MKLVDDNIFNNEGTILVKIKLATVTRAFLQKKTNVQPEQAIVRTR
jgi:hypothetical protein